jgi:hypothetical protein
MTDEAKPGGGASLIADATKVADTSVMKDLLGPSAKILGEYLGDHTRDWVSKLREQKRKNLGDHERKVVEITGEHVDIFNKPETGPAIERWAAVAIDVPIEDPERAAIYEAILAEILSSDRSSDFQDAADRMSTAGMRIFLNAPSDRKILPGADDRGNFEKLRELGLARKLDLARFLLLMLAWSIGTGVGLYILTRIVPSFLPTTFSIGFILEGSVISGLVFAAAMALLYTKYSLTEFGKKLQRSALRFYPTRAKIREFRLASLVPSGFLSWVAVALVLACGAPLLLSRLLSGSESIRTIVLSAPPQASPVIPPVAQPPSPQQRPAEGPTLQNEDVARLIDVWRSVSDQMNSTTDITKQLDSLLLDWPKRATDNKVELSNQLNTLRDTVNSRRVSVATLANFYERYPNIVGTLRGRNADEVFGRLYRALDSFSTEIRALPAKPAESFAGTLRPYAEEVRLAAAALANWASDTRSFSEAQRRELNVAK